MMSPEYAFGSLIGILVILYVIYRLVKAAARRVKK